MRIYRYVIRNTNVGAINLVLNKVVDREDLIKFYEDLWWLIQPPLKYGREVYEFWFTKKGMELFESKCLPMLEKSSIPLDKLTGNTKNKGSDIVYEDLYQIAFRVGRRSKKIGTQYGYTCLSLDAFEKGPKRQSNKEV